MKSQKICKLHDARLIHQLLVGANFAYNLYLGHTIVHWKEIFKDYTFWIGQGISRTTLGTLNGLKNTFQGLKMILEIWDLKNHRKNARKIKNH